MLVPIEGLMSTPAKKGVRLVRDHLYIEPISACNLKCRMCYTNVINGAGRRLVDADTVVDFARRFMAVTPQPAWILWCGTGEIFLHRDFPGMVNRLMAEFPDERLAHSVQTNGTVRRWKEFDAVERLDVCVSIDGSRPFHEWHRGEDTYDRTLDVCREAYELGCKSMQVRMILTCENIEYLDEFHAEIQERIGPKVQLAIFAAYTNRDLDPVRAAAPSIAQHGIEDGKAISAADARYILEHRYQNRYQLEEDSDTVDNYLSLTTYGVYTCCNGAIHIGDPATDMNVLMERLARSERQCLKCSMFPCI